MTWICGMPECRAVRPGLSEVIVDGAKWVAMEGRIRELEAALRTIANADRSYPDKKIADDMQYCARTALETDGECQEHKWERLAINNAKSPADPPEWVYTPYKCVRCGTYQSKIEGVK